MKQQISSNTKCRNCGKLIEDEGIKERFIHCPHCGMGVVVGNRKNVEMEEKIRCK